MYFAQRPDTVSPTRFRPLSRRAALGRGALAGVAIPFLPRLARAAEIVWRVGHSAPIDFALHLRLLEAATWLLPGPRAKWRSRFIPTANSAVQSV